VSSTIITWLNVGIRCAERIGFTKESLCSSSGFEYHSTGAPRQREIPGFPEIADCPGERRALIKQPGSPDFARDRCRSFEQPPLGRLERAKLCADLEWVCIEDRSEQENSANQLAWLS
jgi:hypothetical protein